MMNPIFWKKVKGQKYPGRWEIAGRQIPSVKMLFKTNTKGHKHPSIRLFITERDTIGKPKLPTCCQSWWFHDVDIYYCLVNVIM